MTWCPRHDIGYCSRRNVVSVCGEVTAIDGRDMNRGPLAQNLDNLRPAVNVAWQRLPQATTIIGLTERMTHWIEVRE
ncbi:hypothetical protein TNCV_2580291 [Trichonephila clavipes]|uniref:Uncharacterized protein n=1 Tax=Trichonephila clavipes TaxID=2585209 RepID=A0A8X6S5U8_TRICX|nr:hypothetical protein TNCV_2580291 [Trichonephila clavipes]